MIGCLRTRVRKQPIISFYFEFETVFKFYNLDATTFDSIYNLCAKYEHPWSKVKRCRKLILAYLTSKDISMIWISIVIYTPYVIIVSNMNILGQKKWREVLALGSKRRLMDGNRLYMDNYMYKVKCNECQNNVLYT